MSGTVAQRDLAPDGRRRSRDKKIELFLGVSIAFFAGMQWFTTRSNNESTGRQTDQLITAAKISALASDKNAPAAQNFATTAEKINQDLNRAVDRLNEQASATSDVAKASGVQALFAAQQAHASSAIAESNRQSAVTAYDALYWEQRPWVGVELIQNPTPMTNFSTPGHEFIVIARNTGRTPALKWKEICVAHVSALLGRTPDTLDCETLREREFQAEVTAGIAFRMKQDPKSDPAQVRKDMEDFYSPKDITAPDEGQIIVPEGYKSVNLGEYRSSDQLQHFRVGKFSYYDTIRPTVEHITAYCVVSFGDGTFRLCDFGQDMK